MMSEKPKNTGLGNLLLKRTSPPAEPAAPAAEVGEEEPTPSPAVASNSTLPRKREPEPLPERAPALPVRPPRRRAAKRTRLRLRRTIHLEDDLDEQLSLVAGIEGKERSEIVNSLLRKHLRQYEVTVKK